MIPQPDRRNAFTLVELLAVIAIIGVLVALLLPAVQQAREAARRMTCNNHLKQLGIALHTYHDTYQQFPPGHMLSSDCEMQHASWMFGLLPYIEQAQLAELYVESANWWGSENQPARAIEVQVLVCPSDGSAEIFNTAFDFGFRGTYAANIGVGTYSRTMCQSSDAQTGLLIKGPFLLNVKRTFSDITDGTSNTLAISEIRRVKGNDSRGAIFADAGSNLYAHDFPPNDLLADITERCVNQPEKGLPCTSNGDDGPHRLTARSNHPGGVQALLFDGSGRFVAETIDIVTWQGLASPDGGEVLGEF